jgi:putative transposase
VADHPDLSIARQCQLLNIARSSFYYQPQSPSAEELTLLRLIDQQYLETPFYGSRRMSVVLRQQGYAVNRKRVQRLMRQLGIEAIYPKPRLSQAHPQHQVYPYLLRDLAVTQADQVWCTDITYSGLQFHEGQ